MTLVTYTVILVALTAVVQRGTPADSAILSQLEAGDEVALREAVRLRPDDARQALDDLFRLSTESVHTETRVKRLLEAEQLARVYRSVWSDVFLVRRVEQFRNWSAEERRQKLEADSLRRAGISAFYREGPEAAIRLWERSLGQYRSLRDDAGQATALGNLGAGYYALGQLQRALRYQARSSDLAEAAGDHRTRGNALGNIGNVYKDQGEYARAAEYYGRALEVRPLTGDRRGEAADLNNLGTVRRALQDLKGAEDHFRRALRLNRADNRLRAAAANLTNLANVATLRGEYENARSLYAEALALRRETEDRQGEALDLENLGLLHLRWGDYPAALRALRASLAILDDMALSSRSAEVHSHIAAVLAATGELSGALQELEDARTEAGDNDLIAPLLALQRADLLSELNDFEGAVAFYQAAKAGYVRIGDDGGQSEAEVGLAYLHLARGDYDAAAQSLMRALQVQRQLDDPRPSALTSIMLGDVQAANGDTAAASASYRRALAVHQATGDIVAEASTVGALADLDRRAGKLGPAVRRYRSALALLRDHPTLPARWPLHLGLGLVLRTQGQLEDAAVELRSAIAQVESVSGGLSVPERRYGYLDDKWLTYAELARTEVARGEIAEAFRVNERMRARQLVDVLARGRTNDQSANAALIRAEQTLSRQIAEHARVLRSGTENREGVRGPLPLADVEHAYDALAEARAEYQKLIGLLEESHPEYASLVTGATASLGQVRRLLPDHAVFIEYLVQDEWTMAFVVSKEDVAAVELLVDRRTLRQLIDLFRGSVKPGPVGPGDDIWRTPLRRLHRELIEPLDEAGYLKGKQLLVVGPHLELHYVPFQALLRPSPSGERFLVESFDVAYMPSASAWAQLAQRRTRAPGGGLLVVAPVPDALPHSADEARAVSRHDPLSEVLLGSSATETRFLELAPSRRIIHLATTGVLNSWNPLFSYLRLHPSSGTDGRLDVHEVFGLTLRADLVVLSACETGLSTGARRQVPPGDDWVGLVRAFLYAGARSVLASLWRVDDQATALLMGRFYAGLQDKGSTAAALAEAQRALISAQQYANPYYWAAFALTGGVE
jgi:CHAT domain-containing protein/Tfp pilus assembly protein PilF